VTNNEFLFFGQKGKTQPQNNKTLKTLPQQGIEPGTSCTQGGCFTTAPPSQLN